jgi:hypothetical protein
MRGEKATRVGWTCVMFAFQASDGWIRMKPGNRRHTSDEWVVARQGFAMCVPKAHADLGRC